MYFVRVSRNLSYKKLFCTRPRKSLSRHRLFRQSFQTRFSFCQRFLPSNSTSTRHFSPVFSTVADCTLLKHVNSSNCCLYTISAELYYYYYLSGVVFPWARECFRFLLPPTLILPNNDRNHDYVSRKIKNRVARKLTGLGLLFTDLSSANITAARAGLLIA